MVPEGQKAIQQALLGESEGGDFLDHIFFSEHPLSIESLVKLGLGSIERFLQFIEEGVWAGKLFMETVCKGEKFVWYQNMWDPQHFFLQPFAKWLLPQIPGIPGYVWKGQFPNEKARVDNKESIIASYNIKPEMCPGPTKNMKIVSMITPFPFNLIMDEMREIPQYKPGTFLATFYLSLGDKVDDWPLLMIYALEQQYKTTASRDKGDDEAGTIVEVAQDTPELSTLVAALEAAGLVETLQGEGPFTVFAPTNDAFDALPEGVLEDLLKPENKDTLTEILTYHVVSGAVKASDLEDGQDVETVQGEDVQVTVRDDEGKSKHPRRTIMVNQATVVLEDVMASNGVVHVIDAVLLPPSGVDTDDDTDDDTTDDDTTDDDTMDDDAGDDAGDDMAEVLEDIDEALRAVSGGDLGDVEL
uniref:FAS1 domain-containing protein n=2 Tax=Vitrella brassicaformis TaxID=1169539 RepID=A0A7S1P7J5_9ALVE